MFKLQEHVVAFKHEQTCCIAQTSSLVGVLGTPLESTLVMVAPPLRQEKKNIIKKTTLDKT